MINSGIHRDALKLQLLMNKHGLDYFKRAIVTATQNAIFDTADLENKLVSEQYEEFLYLINDLFNK